MGIPFPGLQHNRLVLTAGIRGELHDLVKTVVIGVPVIGRQTIRCQAAVCGNIPVQFPLELAGLGVDDVNAKRKVSEDFPLVPGGNPGIRENPGTYTDE